MKDKAFIFLLWLHSGAFFFLEYLGPKHGQIFLYSYVILFVVLLFFANFRRGSVLPFQPGFWTRYLLGYLFLASLITLCTSILIDKDVDQVVRRIFYNSYFFLIPYMVFSIEYTAKKLFSQIGVITVVLLLLEVGSSLSGVQLYTSGFVDLSPWDMSEAIAGGFRIVPIGIDVAVFAIMISLAMIGDPEFREKNSQLMVILIAGLLIVLQTFTRDLIAAVFLVMFYWAFFGGGLSVRNKLKTMGMLMIGAISVSSVGQMLFQGDFLEGLTARFLRAIEVGDSWRLMELDFAMDSIAEHPWFGIGLGSTYTKFIELFADEGYAPNANYDIHNMYAGILINYGIIGLGFFLGGVVAFYRLPGRTGIEGNLIAGSKMFLAVGLLTGFFSGGFFNGQSSFWFALLMSYAVKFSTQAKIITSTRGA